MKVAAHQATSDVAVGDGRRQSRHDIGLTVRIEVNLPPDGDADTYDAIFCKHQEAPDVVSSPLDRFEAIARSVGAEQAKALAAALTTELPEPEEPHPFETRNIHPDLPNKVRKLFDDGHWEQSVFEAFKYIETEVKRISALRGNTGYVLMMDVFNESNPKVQLNALVTESEIDEQRGYRYIFAGASAGIRNPRGHEVDIGDTPDEALDYLALASLLLRKLDAAGVR
ncbi:MAG TPA: TIGR02391 family protein [Dermatophilaceae bacterium]|nr:TIGR02391 family protein [Dermatophilaceae bacterium]